MFLHDNPSAPARFARGAVVVLLSTAFFFQVFHFGDGTWRVSGLGGWIDSYFINAILEHWRASLLHAVDPASPPMYFPATHTLGYSCGLILYAPWYVLLRVWCHPFVACTLTIAAVMQVGTWSLYAFLRRGLGLGFVAALALTCSAATSLNVVHPETAAWSQRASVFLLPQMLWLAAVAVTSRSRRWSIAAGAAAGTMFGLLFVQDFPSAAFTTIAGVLVLAGVARTWRGAASVLGAALTPPPGRTVYGLAAALTLWAVLSRMRWFRRLEIGGTMLATNATVLVLVAAVLLCAWPALRRSAQVRRAAAWLSAWGHADRAALVNRAAAMSMAAGAIAGGLVFLYIYLPAYAEHPSFPREQLIASLRAVDPSTWQTPLDAWRGLMAFPSARPFLLVAIVTLLAWMLAPRGVRTTLTWLTATAAIVLLLPLRFPQFSLWLAMVAPLPGLGAVRDPLRLIPFYELALTVGIAAALATATPRLWFTRLAVLATVLVTAATWNGTRFDYERPRAEYARWVEPPIQVDPSCRSFFMTRGPAAYEAPRVGHIWSLYGNDATMIALASGVPTLNGYSGWEPTGWGLANPPAPDYEQEVRRWIAEHQLTDVCALDIAARTMTPWRR